MEGLDRREVSKQSANAALANDRSVTQVPMAGIGGIRPSYVSGISDTMAGLSKVASKAADLIGAYTDEQKKKDVLDGQIWYSQGKTEEQLKADGNYYNTVGYSNAAAVSSGNDWYANELASMDDRKSMDPQAYRSYLMETYSSVNKAIPKADKTTQALVYNQMQENLNKLASAHIVKHQAYNRDMTKQNTQQLILSQDQAVSVSPVPDMDKANLSATINSNPTGLNDEDYKDVLTDVFVTAASQGSTNSMDAFMAGTSAIPHTKLMQMSSEAGLSPMLFSSIVAAESTGMSYDDKGNIIKNPRSSALGPMQTLARTLKDPGYGVAPAKDNSVQELYRVGREYLAAMNNKFGDQSLAVMAFHAGPGRMQDVIQAVGNNPEDVYQYFKSGKAGDTGVETAKYFDKVSRFNNGSPEVLAKIVDKGAAYTALVEKGFNSVQITAVMNSLDKLYKNTAESFSDTRYKATEQLRTSFMADGNSDSLMESVKSMSDRGIISVSDAEHIAGTLAPQWERQRVSAQQDAYEISLAVSNHTIGELSPRLKDAAVKQEYAKIVGEEQAKLQQQQPGAAQVSQEQLNSAILDRQISFLQSNNMVDSDMKARINSGLSIPVAKDGVTNQETINSFVAYQQLVNKAGKDFADRFIDPQNKKLVDYALKNSTTGATPDTALMTARSMLEVEQSSGVNLSEIGIPGTAKERIEIVADATSDFLSNWNPSMFPLSIFDTPTMTGYAQVHDAEVQRVAENPIVQRMVQGTIELELAKGGSLDSAKTAVNGLMNRLTYVMGNPVFSPEGRGNSIQDKAGFNTRGFGDVDLAVQMYLRTVGPKVYGKQWDEIIKNSPNDSPILGMWGGIPWGAGTSKYAVPPGHVFYDSKSEVVVYTPYLDPEKQTRASTSVYIPVNPLGKLYNAEVDKYKTNNITSFSGIANSAKSVIQRLRGGSGIGDY